MGEHGGNKLTGIRQIVRLKEFLRKWQSVTLRKESNSPGRASAAPRGIAPAVKNRLSSAYCDSDEEGSCHSLELPPDVPKGYLAVYVGPEHRRFIIPTSYLRHNLFKVLLEKAEEEYGFEQGGGLTIPCEIETFKYLLKCMEKEKQETEAPNDQCGGELCYVKFPITVNVSFPLIIN